MAGHASNNGHSTNNSASLAHAHLSRNLSPSLLSENFSKNSLVSIVDPQISFYFGNSVSPKMLEQMKRGNEIASKHLEVAKQQLVASVELVQIELKKLESQLRLESSQLRQEVVANYDRVFVNAKGSDAADRLFVHSSMHALALIGMKLKSLHKTRQLSTDLSAEIAIIMLHASPEEQETLVEAFAHEYFLAINGAGSFHQALNTVRENIEQRIAEAEAKRLAEEAEAEAKRLAEEAKRLAEKEQFIGSLEVTPRKLLDDAQLAKFDDYSNVKSYHSFLCTMLYHIQNGNIRVKKGSIFTVAGKDMDLRGAPPMSFFIARALHQEAGIWDQPYQQIFLKHYPSYSEAVFVLGRDRDIIYPLCLFSAYAIHHGKKEMFDFELPPINSSLVLKKLKGMPSNVDSLCHIVHRYLMATEPEYVAFIAALKPYHLPVWAC